jgi:hypothetical protein
MKTTCKTFLRVWSLIYSYFCTTDPEITSHRLDTHKHAWCFYLRNRRLLHGVFHCIIVSTVGTGSCWWSYSSHWGGSPVTKSSRSLNATLFLRSSISFFGETWTVQNYLFLSGKRLYYTVPTHELIGGSPVHGNSHGQQREPPPDSLEDFILQLWYQLFKFSDLRPSLLGKHVYDWKSFVVENIPESFIFLVRCNLSEFKPQFIQVGRRRKLSGHQVVIEPEN